MTMKVATESARDTHEEGFTYKLLFSGSSSLFAVVGSAGLKAKHPLILLMLLEADQLQSYT